VKQVNNFVAGYLLVAGFAILFIAGAMNDSGAPIWLVLMIAFVGLIYLVGGLYILETNEEEDDASRTLRK